MKINQEQKQEYKHLTRSFDQKAENHSSTQAHAYTHTQTNRHQTRGVGTNTVRGRHHRAAMNRGDISLLHLKVIKSSWKIKGNRQPGT